MTGSPRRRSFLSTWRWRGWALGIGALAVATGWVPLMGVLGYELAAWAAVVGSFCGLDVGAAYARARRRERDPAAALPVVEVTARAVGLVWVILAGWAALAALRGLWIPTCDWAFGVATFAALPLASAALAAGTGVSLGLVLDRRGWRTIAPLALGVALVVAALWRVYRAPPVFSYSAIIGYFPGALYDELIELSAPLLWARLEAAAWVTVAIALAGAGLPAGVARWSLRAVTRRRGYVAVAALAGGLATVLASRSGQLGYRPDAEEIAQALGGRHETAHFVIHYARTPAIEREVALLAHDHELRLAQVSQQLGVTPRAKIHSYYFADDDQKARWMGARRVEMAKPWRRDIYLSHEPFPHASLRHEIAHVVAAEFGDRWFGVATREVAGMPLLANPGLIEGLAVAVDWPGTRSTLTPHQASLAMHRHGVRPSLAALFSLRFLAVASARGYTTAGSFVRFLLDTYGPAPLREAYRRGGDFAGAYGVPMPELERKWQAALAQTPLTDAEAESVRERFREVAVFDRPCPHAVAARRARAARAARRGEASVAIELARRVCSDSPHEPRFRLELAAHLARGTASDRDEARALRRTVADDERLTAELRTAALERLAVEAGAAGELAAAKALIARAAALPQGEDSGRQLEAMTLALHHTGPAGDALRSYFFAQRPDLARRFADEAVTREPTSGLARYLRGLRQADDGSWAAMADDLEAAMQLGLPSPRFTRNAARQLAVAAFRVRDPRRVLAAAAALEDPALPQVDRLLAADWRARLRFDSTGRL